MFYDNPIRHKLVLFGFMKENLLIIVMCMTDSIYFKYSVKFVKQFVKSEVGEISASSCAKNIWTRRNM